MSILDMPLEVLEVLAGHLSTRDRFGLAFTCKELWQQADHNGAFWRDLALSTSAPEHSRAFQAWALPRRHLIRSLVLHEPFGPFVDRRITAANLALLCALGCDVPEGQPPAACAALESLVWNVAPHSNLQLAALALPRLHSLELDWMDVHDVSASVAFPAGFGAGLPALTRLALSNVATLRLPPGCLPPGLRRLSFENVYCAGLVPAVVAAATTRLEALHIHDMERRGIALSLAGLERLAPSLTSLLLHHPHQPDPLPHLTALTSLQELTVSHATGTFAPASVAGLARLTALHLPACGLLTLPPGIWALPQLQVLDICENYLGGGLDADVAGATALTRLTLDLQYAAGGGMQLGRLPASLRCLTLVWKPAELPARLCAVLPWLRALTGLRALQLVPSAAWQPGGPNTRVRDCPAALSGLEELAAANSQLSISLSRY